MLLIANFDKTLLTYKSDNFTNLAKQIANELDEPADSTYLISVALKDEVIEKSFFCANYPVKPAHLDSILEGIEIPATSWLIPTASSLSNYNRMAEQLLAKALLGNVLDGSSWWQWDDQGAIVVIPPTDPALAMFLTHALFHYMEEVDFSAGLHVVIQHQPLQMQKLD